MSEMETRFKEDLHQQLEAQKADAEGNITDAVEKAKLEGTCMLKITFWPVFMMHLHLCCPFLEKIQYCYHKAGQLKK